MLIFVDEDYSKYSLQYTLCIHIFYITVLIL